MNRRALKGREKALEIEYLNTLINVNNLASMLQYRGKYKDAEKMNRRALEGREKALGAEHPDTLASVSNLASVLRKQRSCIGETWKEVRRCWERSILTH
jgi:hypothetical protein